MKYKNKGRQALKRYFINLFFVIFLMFIVATSPNKDTVVTSNINTVKSIESSRIIRPERNEEIVFQKPNYQVVTSTNEIKMSENKLIEFTGTITGYGPDCVGCSGILACPPNQNVLNNNIYYNDEKFGKIRILAADPSIPCGSIIKVSNYDNNEFIGIVLDRGRDIHGLTMDLLYESEKKIENHGRKYNIDFKIERWGF